MAPILTDRTPLLRHAHKRQASSSNEFLVLATHGIPLVAMSIMRYVTIGVSIFSLSRLGTLELAAGNLGFVTVNMAGYSIIMGLTASLDTLANQASKSDSPKLASLYAMRTAVVCYSVMPFILLLQWNSLTIFHYILPHGDPEMLRMASSFCKIFSLCLPALAGYECIRRYLQSFGYLNGVVYAYSIATPLSCFLNYLLVHGSPQYRLGFIGAPVAITITFWCLFASIAMYAVLVAPRQYWAGFSRAVFQDLGLNYSYAFSGVISICSEWWAFELISLEATYLGLVMQAASAIYMTTLSLCKQVPNAISMAGSLRIGNLLGAGLPHQARVAARVAQTAAAVSGLLTSLLLLVFSSQLGRIFSTDPEVIESIQTGIFLVSVVLFFDGMQGVNSGILRGAGQPAAASRVNVIGYWLVGLPVGAILAFNVQDVRALWPGLAIAVLCTSASMGILIWRNDWEARANEAQERLLKSREHVRGEECGEAV